MSRYFQASRVSLLFQAFAAAKIEDRDGKEEDGRRNENYVLHKNLLDYYLSVSECPRSLPRKSGERRAERSQSSQGHSSERRLRKYEMYLKIL